MKKSLSLLLALALTLSLAACAASDPSQSQGAAQPSEAPQATRPEPSAEPSVSEEDYYPVTITTYDYEGSEIETTCEKAPEKVLCVYQGTIETMIALGLEDHVAASYGLDNPVKSEWEAGLAKMNYNEDVFAPDKEGWCCPCWWR